MTRRVPVWALMLLAVAALAAPVEAQRAGEAAPEIAGTSWLNSPPLSLAALRGRVVAVEFWTYG